MVSVVVMSHALLPFLLPASSKQFRDLISLTVALFSCLSNSACPSTSACPWPSYSLLCLACSALSPVVSLSSQLQPQPSPFPVLSFHLILQCQSMHTVLLFSAGFLLCRVVFWGSGKPATGLGHLVTLIGKLLPLQIWMCLQQMCCNFRMLKIIPEDFILYTAM